MRQEERAQPLLGVCQTPLQPTSIRHLSQVDDLPTQSEADETDFNKIRPFSIDLGIWGFSPFFN